MDYSEWVSNTIYALSKKSPMVIRWFFVHDVCLLRGEQKREDKREGGILPMPVNY